MTNPLSAYASSAWSRISSCASSAYEHVPQTPEFMKQGGSYIADKVTLTYNATKSRVPDWFPFGGYGSSMLASCGAWIDSGIKRLGFEGGLSGISNLWQKAV